MALDATKLELGPANVYIVVLPKSVYAGSAGTNKDIRLQAIKPGATGDAITLTIVVAGNNTVLSVVTTSSAIVVNSATDGSGVATSTADQIIAAINANPGASGLVSATRKTGNNGTGITGAIGLTPLSGGSGVGVETNVGFLGDNVALQMTATAVPLTGAQTGSIPQDKVVTGGSFVFVLPFKEITLDNYLRAFPNAVIYEDGGGLRRLDYKSKVGQSMRALAVRMVIKKIIGGVETTDPKQIFIIPEISPVDGQITLPFSPTTQRELLANYEAWPDANGRWAFTGDETL